MLKIIRNAEIYAPKYLGKRDLLIAAGKICEISEKIDINSNLEIEYINGEGLLLTPGFIDNHQHIIGGGGEGGFSSRTSEVNLSELVEAGVTTVVGCIGTDSIGRDSISLLAKANSLEEEGISAFIYTGSYRVPVTTITEDLMKDIMLIEKVIGVGEIAISDHRSSQPTFEEFARLVADARVAGMLSGKAGVVNVHLGDGDKKMSLINQVIKETEIPVTQFLPTHTNRSESLFKEAMDFAKIGGTIDLTANENIDYWETVSDEVRVSKAIKTFLEQDINTDNFTISSDGQGSFPVFDKNQEYVGMGVGKANSLRIELLDCVQRGIPLEIALKGITSNVANVLKLKNKGGIAVGMDADICLLDKEKLEVHTVIAKGIVLLNEGKLLTNENLLEK